MARLVLSLRDIRLRFGADPLFDGAELAVHERARICIVGRNGSGKSTLMKIAAGMVEPDDGERFAQPDTTIRYLPQEPDLAGFETVGDYVRAGLAPGDAHHRADELLSRLGLGGGQAPATLSGGEARRAALARTLAPEPDILLLDEPTNHLDLPAIEWLEAELSAMSSALVLISHDRRFLENLSQAVVWIDRGQARRLERGFAHFEEWRDEILEHEEIERHKLEREIVAQEHWLRYGVTARRKRNQGRLRKLLEMREQVRTERRAQGSVAFTTSAADASGRKVIEADAISKSFGDKPVIDGLSLRVMRQSRIGIIGPNGAGKTTLVNILTGEMAPDSGTVTLGTGIEMASLDQRRAGLNKRRAGLDPDETLARALAGGDGDTVHVNGAPRHVISYMKDFLFTPEQARQPVSALSGGERGRLMLARALARQSNLLVLDEPTNDLDLETLDLLQEFLADYPGTALIVSHDRDFLDRVATSILMSEGDGRWREYQGGYSDAIAQRQAATPSSAPRKAAIKPASKPPGRPESKPDGKPQAAPAPSQPARARLTFKEKFALEQLPVKMAEYEAQIADLEARLAGEDFYATDPDGFAAAAKLLDATREALAAAEEAWLELEMKREALETSKP